MITKITLEKAGINGESVDFVNEDGNIYGVELISDKSGLYVIQLYNPEKTGSKLLGATTKHGMVSIETN